MKNISLQRPRKNHEFKQKKESSEGLSSFLDTIRNYFDLPQTYPKADILRLKIKKTCYFLPSIL